MLITMSDNAALITLLSLWAGFFVSAYYVIKDKRRDR